MEQFLFLAFALFMAYGLINFTFARKPGYVKSGPHTEVYINSHGEVSSIRLSPEYVESKEFKDKLMADQAMVLEDILRQQEDRNS